MSAIDAESNKSTLKKLLPSIKREYSIFCRVLEQEYREKTYLELGYKNFETYVTSGLGINYRTAFYYVQIGQTFKGSGIQDTLIDSIGWAKAKEFKGVPSDKFNYLMEYCRNHSVDEVINEARRLRGLNHSTKRISVNMQAEDAKIVDDALRYVGGTRSEALLKIIREWGEADLAKKKTS